MSVCLFVRLSCVCLCVFLYVCVCVCVCVQFQVRKYIVFGLLLDEISQKMHHPVGAEKSR